MDLFGEAIILYTILLIEQIFIEQVIYAVKCAGLWGSHRELEKKISQIICFHGAYMLTEGADIK